MECDVNYPHQQNRNVMNRFDLTMTYHRSADVFAGYLGLYLNEEGCEETLRRPPGPKEPGNLASMFISSAINKSGRFQYASELMQYLDVHSYGRSLNNRRLPGPDRGRSTKLAQLSRYKFDLSFENAIGNDYVTEKFYDPLMCGTVPVYLGAPNVSEFAPGERCFIDVSDFASAKELAEYLLFLDQDDDAYAEYFAWKENPFLPPFQKMVDEQSTPAFARLCEVVRSRSPQPNSSP